MNPTTTTTTSTTVSEAQLRANRENARRSTGPRTEEGKAASSQNARVHGLCSKQLHVADAEEAELLASLRDSLAAELRPQGELELTHFETIVHARWNLRRCRMNEADLLAKHPNPFLDPETRTALKTLGIYTSRHERAHVRALKDLQALQNERAARTNFEDEPSPLVETVRIRRAILAEVRTKAAINKAALTLALDKMMHGPAPAPISYFQFDLAPPAGTAAPLEVTTDKVVS